MIGLQFIQNAAIKYGAYLLSSSGFLSHAHLPPNALSKHKQKHRQSDRNNEGNPWFTGRMCNMLCLLLLLAFWAFDAPSSIKMFAYTQNMLNTAVVLHVF